MRLHPRILKERISLFRNLIAIAKGRPVTIARKTLRWARADATALRRRAKYYGLPVSPGQIVAVKS